MSIEKIPLKPSLREIVTFTPFTVMRFAMHRKTNLLVTSTRSSVCCANLILGFSVNFVHRNTSRNVTSEQ